MSRRLMISRVLAAAGALLVLVIGLSVPTSGLAAVPVPQATTTPATPSPSPSASGAEAEPDDMTDDGTNTTPPQTGTWLAVGVAAAVSLAAGAIVVLRKR